MEDLKLDLESESEGQEQTFKLGEDTYTQEELDQLVGLGKIAREVEQKYNTKIDRVYPEFTKKSQLLKDYENKISELEGKISKQPNKDLPEDEQIRQAKDAARKLNILLKDDFSEAGVVTKDDFKQLYREMREGEKMLEGVQALEKEITGKDGRPRFDAEEILTYMQETGINDPKAAYKIKYETQLTEWQQKEMGKAKKPGYMTEERGYSSSKQPSNVRPTNDNLEKLVSEALNWGE